LLEVMVEVHCGVFGIHQLSPPSSLAYTFMSGVSIGTEVLSGVG
jgi:hypothetical protein